jgi:hypothetical protein
MRAKPALLGFFQKRLRSIVILGNAATPLCGFQLASRSTLLALGRLLQPVTILRLDVLGLRILLIAIAKAEGVVVVGLGVGRNRGEGLPLLTTGLAWGASLIVGRRVPVQGIDFVYGSALGWGHGRRLEKVGICLRPA